MATPADKQVDAALAQLAQAQQHLANAQLHLANAQERVRQQRLLEASALLPLGCDELEMIFLLLPVNSRLRCREVCRAWRAFLDRENMWHVCIMLPASGEKRRSEELLRAASARAGGSMRVLVANYRTISAPELLAVVSENSASLRKLSCITSEGPPFIAKLLSAAPQLDTLEVIVRCSAAELVPMLRNDPPYGPLRLAMPICVGEWGLADMSALAAAAPLHSALTGLGFFDVRLTAETLDVLVSPAISQKLARLSIHTGYREANALTPQSLPALARLLTAGLLSELTLVGHADLFAGIHLSAFATALRASRLRKLSLSG